MIHTPGVGKIALVIPTRVTSLAGVVALAALTVGVGAAEPARASSRSSGIHKIKHVIVIMQENRSFDCYFGTYPKADGFPTKGGKLSPCVPDAKTGSCDKPFLDHADRNGGGPHGEIERHRRHQRRQDGRLRQPGDQHAARVLTTRRTPRAAATDTPDVMGYHDGGDIPNYWAYADDFVLQDHMFEPNASWSLPAHLYQVSEWSASCTQHDNPSSCTNALQGPGLAA